MNVMKNIKIEKLTLNIGAGSDQAKLEKGMKLLQRITNVRPVKTVTTKRIAEWGLRAGLPIGCKVTLRKEPAKQVLIRLLAAKGNRLRESQFNGHGNIAFGIHEYIDIPSVKYDPEIGIIGLEVCITLERAGYRIKRRKIMKRKIHHRHIISKNDAIEFMKKEFNIKFGEEE